MTGFKKFLGSMLGGSGEGRPREPGQGTPPGAPVRKGDFIGQKYEVYDTLGKGGFGVVYLVYSRETKQVHALKTFRDEYLADAQTRDRFRKEAQVWVDLERHPYLVRAYFVDQVAGRLYIGMQYVAPDEQGLNSLEGYLQRRPPDLAQSLRWAIQFCYGMEYAYSKGVRCHRDIKPANILICQDRTLKISDFGLAGVLGSASRGAGISLSVQDGRVGLSGQTMDGAGFGTPTHMPPEQFVNAAACDEKSDVYAFGVVLYQMVTGGRLPFLAPLPRNRSVEEQMRCWREMHSLHRESPVPRLDSPLSSIVQRCLQKDAPERYQSFRELRSDLEPMLKRESGEVVRPPTFGELEVWEWVHKGVSLWSLGHHEEALRCYDKALRFDSNNAIAWNNKGNSLANLGRYEEALYCYDEALRIDPHDATAWYNKANGLDSLGRSQDALSCYDQALRIDPRHAGAWTNKGVGLKNLGRDDEAIRCYDEALRIDSNNAIAWHNKGVGLQRLGRYEGAIRCCDEALRIDPQHAYAWNNKGSGLQRLGRYEDAIRCYDEAILIEPRYVDSWTNKGMSLANLGRYEDAIRCYDEALRIDPNHTGTWNNKGAGLWSLGRYEEAVRCYDEALRIDPRDPAPWYAKAVAEDELARPVDAARSYRRFIALAPAQYASLAERARWRVRELEGKVS